MDEHRPQSRHGAGRRGGAPRLADVAASAGVSPALASRVLNEDPKVRASAETRQRVREAARALGYVPNVAARSLRVRRTGLLGLVVHDLSSPIYLDLLQGARSEAASAGYFLVLGDVDELLGDDDAFTILVNGRRVDGLVVQGGHREFDRRVADMARALPIVIVNTPPRKGRPVAPHVYPDEAGATRTLTEHLLELGHRRIGLISGPADSPTSLLREEGVRTALAAAGVELRDEDTAHTTWSADGGRDGIRELAARWTGTAERPTALIGGNSLIGIGMLGAAAGCGIAVPQQLSVAAVHDSWISEHLVPSLTTVSLPLREMGRIAVRRLLGADGGAETVVVADPAPRLHPRGSTGPVG